MKIFDKLDNILIKKKITNSKFDDDKTYQDNNTDKEVKSSIHRRRRDENRELGFITYFFLGLFVCMLVYLGLYTQFRSGDVINNPYNKRQQLLESRIIRGDILSSNGEKLATTIYDNGEYKRQYPYGNLFSHIVGYSTHGVLGIESNQNFRLLECNDSIVNRISNDLSGERNHGDNIITSLNMDMQKAAYDALGGRMGAVIAMNAKTGEILAVVSKPDFDPNKINENWDNLNNENNNSPLLNRALLGSYPPGSTFKIVTALEYLKEKGEDFREYDYDCTGSFSYKGSVINCYHGQLHGELDLNMSFAKSCNSSFANITSTFDKQSFYDTCDSLLFNKGLPLDLPHSKSRTTINIDSSTDELLQTGIGQGKTLISPVHMCLITAAIANNGLLMRPSIISQIKNNSGVAVKTNKPEIYGQLIDSKSANLLQELMRDVILYGTGSKLRNSHNYEAAGKTGSAEYLQADKSLSHAWFTGFGRDKNDTIVVTVLVEGGGSGGDTAVPIAKSVFDAYFD